MMDEWKEKMGYIYTIHNGILFNHKNEESSPIHENMDRT